MKSNGQFTQRAELAIENARLAAGSFGHGFVGTEHLVLGITMEHEGLGARILDRRGISESALRRVIGELDGTGAPGTPGQGLTTRARIAVERAAAEASAMQQGYIGTEHILLGVLRQSDSGGVRALTLAGADANDLYTDIMDAFGAPASRGKPQTGTARQTIRRAETRILDQYSRDLTELALSGATDPVVGREARYCAPCRSSPAGRRITPCSWASRALARPPWRRGWRCWWRAGKHPRSLRESASCRWIYRRCSRGRNTAATLRSA